MGAVAITGLGAVCGLGVGTAALWSAVAAGRDGIRPLTRFSTADYRVHLAAAVPGYDQPQPKESSHWDRWLCVDFALLAAREALAQAAFGSATAAPHRIAVVLGTSLGHRTRGLHTLAEEVAEGVGARGLRLTLSTACTSSTTALGLGKDLLERGAADVVLAGGTDTIIPEMFAGFHALGLLSEEKCAPFSSPYGTTLGEGAGVLVLERLGDVQRRAATVQALLLGYALSVDGYHATSPDPSGAGVARAVRLALLDAGVTPDDIDYVNAHGTGTASNDPAEALALQLGLGPRADRIPISSSKSFLGHAQGAAGALETIVTLLAMQHGAVPHTANFKGPRPRGPADPVGEPRPRPHPVRSALCTNSAFGGANTAVVVSAAATIAPGVSSAAPGQVWVCGAGAVGPHGPSVEALVRAVAARTRLGGRAAPFDFERLVPQADPRGLDRSGVLLTAAVATALSEAGLLPRGAARERTGLFTGAQRISPETVAEHDAAVAERGLAKLSSSAFTRLVLNAASGACARLLGLKGPGTTLSTAHGSGLVCAALAASALATRRDADVLVAAGVDEVAAAEDPTKVSEGAACLVLGSKPVAPPGRRPVRLAGLGLAGPGRLAEAEAEACARAGLSAAQVSAPPDAARVLGPLVASGSLFAAAAAWELISRGEAEAVLVSEPGGDSAACALVLSAG